MSKDFYFTPTDARHADERRMQEAFHTGRFLVQEVAHDVFKLTDMEDEFCITVNAQGIDRKEMVSVLVQAMQQKMSPESIPNYYLDIKSGLALLKSE